MKLLSLQYSNVANSLKTYDFDFANGREFGKKLDPLCFVGLNGAGKSKLIEIIAEIFFLLDANRENTAATKSQRNSQSNFKLQYQLRTGRTYQVVKVEGWNGKPPQIFVDDIDVPLSISKYDEVLPSNIIGYSSGHNETISPLFLALRDNDLANISKAILAGKSGDVDQTRTLFLDRDTTKLLLLTAYIFKNTKGKDNYPTKTSSRLLFQKFSQYINLEKVLSFQMVIDRHRESMRLSRRMEETLNKLQLVSLLDNEGVLEKKERYVLDFFLDDISIKAFISLFKTPQNFFQELYELNSLNLVYKSIGPEESIFSIPDSELKVELNSPIAEATYQSLSDGEHQFIQIFGAAVLFGRDDSLFLLDEPESHFNPAWRAKFVFILDELLGKKQKSAEFLISTHSPYLVSACKKKNVIKFVRNIEGIAFERLEDETYGASFDVLLKALFDMKGLVAEIAKKDLQAIVQQDLPVEEKVIRLEKEFGDSYEKRLLINMLKKGLLDAVSD